MIRELVLSSLKISYSPGILNPADINESSLMEIGLIDEKNQIDRNMLRVGSLGTHIFFSNNSKDEIKAYPTILIIESNDKKRLETILNGLQIKFGIIPIEMAEYRIDEHLLSKSLPKEVFDKFSQSKIIDVETIHFKKDIFKVYLYSCDTGTIHVCSIAQNTISKNMADFNLNGDLEVDKLQRIINDFISTDLAIS